jgi:hypothetical protein
MSAAIAILDASLWDVTKAGALYFAVVFAAGFVLGATRTRWVARARRNENGRTDGSSHHARGHNLGCQVDGCAPCSTVCVVDPTRYGFDSTCFHAGCGTRACAPDSRPLGQAVSCWAGPRFRECLLCDARGVCDHAAAGRKKMRLTTSTTGSGSTVLASSYPDASSQLNPTEHLVARVATIQSDYLQDRANGQTGHSNRFAGVALPQCP